jgi:crotonobetainyl-CoA:carnitine CoA-transferase CaiB-like acyl-CoA transferase
MHARFEYRAELVEELGRELMGSSAAEWVERLRPLGIAAGEVVDLGDALDGDLARSRGMVMAVDTPAGPLRMVGNPIRCAEAPPVYRPPPRLHEHTGEVVGERDGGRDHAS